MSKALETKLAAGTRVGAYRIDAPLGEGGMGAVYAATDPTINKRVAIKVLRHSLAEDAGARARFEREARAANEVRHPGIVDVLATGELEDGRPYLVMSLLEGTSLRRELDERGRLPAGEAWGFARQVAAALAAAHDAGVVHRDLKPDNVFLERFEADREGARRARILDFGIARMAEGLEPRLTATGVPLGTPAYMAPEQWWGEGITAATDQYAFGILLFELLTGKVPFEAAQFVAVMQRHLNEAPPGLGASGVPVPPAVEALLARLLAKSSGDRFASMAAVLEAGDRAFGGSGAARLAVAGPPEPPVSSEPRGSRSGSASPVTPPLGVAPTLALTLPVLAAPATPLVPYLAQPFRRYLALHAAVVGLGSVAVVAVGYAGYARRDVGEWLIIGGAGQLLTLALFAGGAAGLVLVARHRATTGAAGLRGFWLALLPALSGALATYANWRAILVHLGDGRGVDAAALFDLGTYEANASRFLGFSASALLVTSLCAIPGFSGVAGATSTLAGALGVRRREATAAAFGLAVLGAAAVLLGAPSGALVAGTAAAVLAMGALAPTVHDRTAARDEVERALAGLLAVGLAVAAGLTRVEAREAALWGESPTRAARVAEILAAQGERTATMAIAFASAAVVGVVEGVRFRRLARSAPLGRPGAAALGLMAVLALATTGDVIQHGRFIARRDELRGALSRQFDLFARLDPPAGDGLDPLVFAPHRAPALQVGREAVAVNAQGVARLAALSSPDGAAHLASELDRALAQAVAEEEGPTVHLSLSVDREVKGSTLLRLLAIARGAGATRLELLLTRGESPRLPASGPPELRIVVPRDFVALAVELGDAGLSLDAERTFGQLAPELIAATLSASRPVRLRVPLLVR